MVESGTPVAFDLWEAEGFSGGIPVEDTGQPGPDDRPRVWRLTIYRTGSPITLTDVLPRLHHLGVEVVDEHPYEFSGPGLPVPFWIYDFGLRPTGARAAASAAPAPASPPAAQAQAAGPPHPGPVKGLVEDTLDALWRGQIEDDGFNALVLDAHLSWRQVMVLRAYAKYLRQAGTRFSHAYIERVLRSNTTVTRLLVRLFESRFDPARQAGQEERSEAITEEIRGELDDVAVLDHDRVLRAYLGLILATLRTNYFADQAGRSRARSRARHRAGPVPGGQAGRGGRARPAGAPAEVRAVRVLTAAGSGAPEVRRGRPGRAALVGPQRGLPHRDPRAGQGAGGQELRHRAVRRQGRLRLQAAARRRRPGRLPGRGAGLLPDVHQRHAGGHRQPAGGPGGAAARRGQVRRGRPLPGGRGGQGHRDVLRHRQRDRAELRVLAGRRVRLRRIRGLRPQEDGHHRPGGVGIGQVPLRHPGSRRRHHGLHGGRDR